SRIVRPATPQRAPHRAPSPYGYFPPPVVRRRRGCCTLSCVLLLLIPIVCFGSVLLLYFIVPPKPLDIVILGVDAREGEGWYTRTDSIMLLNITPRRLDVTLLSIPRDVFIRVPGYGEQRIDTINVRGEQEARDRGSPALVNASLPVSHRTEGDPYVPL